MFENIKERFLKFITSRQVALCGALILMACVLVMQLFSLQIVHGEENFNKFKFKVETKRSIPATRGNIYDRNGNILAWDTSASCVTITDVFNENKNSKLNEVLNKTIDIIEKKGDEVDLNNFDISLDESGKFVFAKENHLPFLRDVYHKKRIEELYDPVTKDDKREYTATQVIDDLCKDYKIGTYLSKDEKGKPTNFVPRMNYSNKRVLQLVAIRYNLSSNLYQKYISTTISSNVKDVTVAAILENQDVLEGVQIEDKKIRKYGEDDSKYFSHLLGYTGSISQNELDRLQDEEPDVYDKNDTIGLSGVEKLMEKELRGKKGSETIYVDNMGRVIERSDPIEPEVGNNVYLTIDKDLTIACYDIIEHDLAKILTEKIKNVKFYKHSEKQNNSSDIVIPIYDVYFALFDNNSIDIKHLSDQNAKTNEKAVYNAFLTKKKAVLDQIRYELVEKKTSYDELSPEYKWYMSTIANMLVKKDGIVKGKPIIGIDEDVKADKIYKKWENRDDPEKAEKVSLSEFIQYAILNGWTNTSGLKNIESQYADSEEIYNGIVDAIIEKLDNAEESFDFQKRMYKYMLLDENISGDQVCNILLEQSEEFKNKIPEEELDLWLRGGESPYEFLMKRIKNLDITPAELALDPCTASMVVTDVTTGDVLALVSYPGYDNNKMANGVNIEYYAKLSSDKTEPLYNHATQQLTAPGSTFKMVSATAGLSEGIINTSTSVHCGGVFSKLSDHPPYCWKRGGHGSLNVTGGIRNSCNVFFYDIGYRLASQSGYYASKEGLERLKKYADLYGLTDTSGIGIEEKQPQFSDVDAVRSAIGQGSHNYSTVGLARYVTTVANSGTCYDLNLIKCTKKSNDDLIKDYKAQVRNTVDLPKEYWDAIHTGMRGVVLDKPFYSNLGVNVAGKTGTAEESKSRPNHSLFVCYAPYENPKIAVATRIAHGYTSSYAAQFTKDALAYYFGLADLEDEILSDSANALQDGATFGD
ncbi:MAG: penicillin-binding protein [Butyrivibrio sp.]|nr:penicillin-binding protein [Butyrivibrio sp.]